MSTTLQTARNVFYDVLREQEDTSAYPLTLCDLLLNSGQMDFCSGLLVNPVPLNQNLADAKKGKLPFLQTDKYYSNVQDTTLSIATTVGAVTLTVGSTTDFPSSGTLIIAGNTIPYAGKTSTTFTTCSNVLFAHEAGSQVSIAFTLPTDYMSPLNVIYNNRFKLRQVQYDDIFEEMNGEKWNGSNMYYNNTNNAQSNYGYGIKPFYTIKDSSYIIPYNLNNTGGMMRFRYEKKPTTMTASSDTFTIDDDNVCQMVIPFFAVGNMLYHRGEEGRASELLNFAIAEAKKAYKKYDNQTYEEISGVQYGVQGSGKLNI